MLGPVALIAVLALPVAVVRYRLWGSGWPLAAIRGVRLTLLGVIALYGLIIAVAVGAGTTRAILHPVGDTLIALFPDSQPPASRAGRLVVATRPTEPISTQTSLPTPTPRVVVAQAPKPRVKLTPIALAYEAVVSPQDAPTTSLAPELLAASTPAPKVTATPAPEEDREGCDPSYPDGRTCIPPGPPWDQGCAITVERNFTVLPPDRQGLDHDRDGIGCEPIS